MVKRVVLGISGDYAQLTGGYAYDRRVLAELRALGWEADFLDVGSGYPRPDAATLATTRRQLASVPAGTPLMIDGLVFGLIPDIAGALAPSHPLIALVHHPLALETGWSKADTERLRASERAALACARAVVATSATTGDILARRYGVPRECITVALPGNDRHPAARGSGSDIVSLLSVGAIVPRKGHDILVAALAKLSELDSSLRWHLTIAGDPDRSPETLQSLTDAIERLGLGERIVIAGGVPDDVLVTLYDRADVFVLASHYEGYGMAYTEALARGLPVIGTTGGAIPEAVPHGAGLLVEPGDAQALSFALHHMIAGPAERQRFAEAAQAAARNLPLWRDTALHVARAIEAVT